jgi:hypothetical protein
MHREEAIPEAGTPSPAAVEASVAEEDLVDSAEEASAVAVPEEAGKR